jgi:hypothetical protein
MDMRIIGSPGVFTHEVDGYQMIHVADPTTLRLAYTISVCGLVARPRSEWRRRRPGSPIDVDSVCKSCSVGLTYDTKRVSWWKRIWGG